MNEDNGYGNMSHSEIEAYNASMSYAGKIFDTVNFSAHGDEDTSEDVSGFMRPCEYCNGSGTFKSAIGSTMTCPDCDGTGIYSEGKDLPDDELFLQSLAKRDADVTRLENELAAANETIEFLRRQLREAGVLEK